MTRRLDGKVAIVTGAARGQGEAEARRFVAEGAKVLLTDVLDDIGSKVADDLGPNAAYRHLDVGDESQWADAVADCEDRFGPVTVLVNNAGILQFEALDRMTLEQFERIMRVNVTGTFLGIRAVTAGMAGAGGGSIVNISSNGGLTGLPYVSAYVTSKFAVRGLTKAAAAELGRKGIRVNSVHPGGIDTEMSRPGGISNPGTSPFYQRLPISRMGSVDEVANLVLYLASDESSYSTASEFVVDGGATGTDNGILDQ